MRKAKRVRMPVELTTVKISKQGESLSNRVAGRTCREPCSQGLLPVESQRMATVRNFTARQCTFLVSMLLVLSLATPTLLCMIPGVPKTLASSDCCEHMKRDDCRTARMSACCETSAPGTALSAESGKSYGQL